MAIHKRLCSVAGTYLAVVVEVAIGGEAVTVCR